MTEGAAAPDPHAYAVHRSPVRDTLQLGYLHEGAGGLPIVLLHGYPESKRIWWRNVGPLAEAGFEVIAPDLRGYADSDLAPDGCYDPAACARDVYALVHDVLGHDRCVMAAGDVGGVVMLDLAARFPGFVDRMVFFNSVPPALPDTYTAAGLPASLLDDTHPTGDYRIRQGRDGAQLIAELDTPERRRDWVAAMYTHRLWGTPGGFSPADVDFMTEPFADPAKLQASWGPYALAYGGPLSEIPMLFQPVTVPTLVLYGPDDHVVPAVFVDQCELAFTDLVGPFLVPHAGHFLQWERADVFNRAVTAYCRDLLVAHAAR